MIDKNETILRNLEDQVQYLTDINQLASLGFRVRGKVDNSSQLVVDDRCVNGDVMLVGTDKPYHLWVFVSTEWVDLGEFPRRGLPGIKGERGESIVGPRGPEGKPSNVPGPAGKNGNGIGVDHISKINLSTGNPSITYNTTNGATLSKSGQITAAGTNYDITVDDKLPIVAGDNITIAANETNNALKISAASSPVTSVNGQTGEVNITVPTKTSQLTNDSGFITNSYHDSSKQDTLVSGSNIKTINNQSIVGSGNITIESGTAGVTSLNGKTGAINIVEGSNVTVNTSGNTITISATGGGGGGGTVELPFITLTPTQNTYPINSEFTNSDAAKLTDSSFSSILLKPSGSDYYVPMLPQASQRDNHQYIWEGNDGNYTYTITGTLQKQLDASQAVVWTAKFYTIDQELYSNPNVKQTTGFYRYDGIINSGTAGTEIVVGGTYQYNDNVTIYRDTNGCTYTQGQMIIDRNGVISKVIDPTHARVAYIPQSGGVTSLNGHTGDITIAAGTNVTISESNNTLTINSTGGGGGGGTLYQHTLTYSSDKFSDTDQFSGEGITGQFSISFYSTHGEFIDASDFWTWLIGRGSISVCDGQLWGNMGGGEAFTRINVLGDTDAEKYIQFESYGGYGSWNPLGHFLKNPASTGLTDTIVDGFRDM